MADRADDYFVCPHCGEEVAVGAKACPHCGSDDRTGWSEDADKWAADLPAGYSEDDEFDYEEFMRREFPEQARSRSRRVRAVLLAVLVAVLVLALVLALARG